jgi:glutamate--cysteine ligase
MTWLNRQQLLDQFRSQFRPGPRRVGLEYELLPLDPKTGHQLPYAGERSVSAALRHLIQARGWHADSANSPLLALTKNDARLTLEPGAQVELSGAPKQSIAQVAAELEWYLDDLREAASALEIAWVAVGVTPLDRPEAITVIPKQRYEIMTRYLATRGRAAWWMMRATAGIQVNFDLCSPHDAASALRLFLRAAPVLSALFANSRYSEGRLNGWCSRREAIWTEVDPDRCGYPPDSLSDQASVDDYASWVMRTPSFFRSEQGQLIDTAGQPFLDVARTLDDWSLHLTTVFPEVRIKQHLELRCVDSHAPQHALTLAALGAGLAYGGDAVREEALRLLGAWPLEDHRTWHLDCARQGLDAAAPDGRSARQIAAALFELAERGLAAWSASDRQFLQRDLLHAKPEEFSSLQALIAARSI